MKKHTRETINKIRESSKKRVFSKKVRDLMTKRNIEINGKKVVCLETGEEFESISEAARSINTAPICVSRVANGKKQSIKGFSYRFLEE